MTLAILVFLGSLIQEGTLHGVVTDPHEAVVPGVHILIAGKHLKREIRTDEKGEFEVHLPTGTYRLEIRTPGFKPFIKKGIKIKDAAAVSLRIPLSVVQFSPKCPSNGVCL